MLRKRRNKILRWIAFLGMVATAGLVLLYYCRPAQLRLVKLFPSSSILPQVSPYGFFECDGYIGFGLPSWLRLHGWDNTVRWQVDLSVQRESTMQRTVHLSQDKRVVAVFDRLSKSLVRLMTWQDGKYLGALSLPCLTNSFFINDSFGYRITPLDDGRILLLQDERKSDREKLRLRMLVVKGNHILASGHFLSGLTPLNMINNPTFSSDGSILICRVRNKAGKCNFEYTSVYLKEQVIVFSPRYIDEITPFFGMGSAGMVLSGDGAVFSEQGRCRKPDDWCAIRSMSFPHFDRWIPQYKGKQLRAFDVQTGTAWQISTSCEPLLARVTPHGRFMAVLERMTENSLAYAIHKLLGLPQRWLRVYEQPGKLRAQHPIKVAEPIADVMWADNEDAGYLQISPNGHRVLYSDPFFRANPQASLYQW